MKSRTEQIEIDDLVVDVIRKDVKHLYFAVCPPNGRVRVTAPFRLDDEAVRSALALKLPWIRRQKAKFDKQVRNRPLEYVSGESHYYQGERFSLKVIFHDGPPGAALHNNGTLVLYVRMGSDAEKRERALMTWYRGQLKEAIPPLVDKWEAITGEDVAEWGVKRMKTRWGSCNIKARRIWLNLELIKKPPHCLEYIILHEMLHLKERFHNARFKRYMDDFMPQWRSYQEELDKTSLASAYLGY